MPDDVSIETMVCKMTCCISAFRLAFVGLYAEEITLALRAYVAFCRQYNVKSPVFIEVESEENIGNGFSYLTNDLKDGRLEISNNRAERIIKPFVIDWKNFQFANTPKGSAGSAVMFSLIQTAIKNHLDPYKYLTWLLKMANTADRTQTEEIKKLLPWQCAAQSSFGHFQNIQRSKI